MTPDRITWARIDEVAEYLGYGVWYARKWVYRHQIRVRGTKPKYYVLEDVEKAALYEATETGAKVPGWLNDVS